MGRACDAHDNAALIVLREQLQGAEADEEALVKAKVALQWLDLIPRRAARLAALVLQRMLGLRYGARTCNGRPLALHVNAPAEGPLGPRRRRLVSQTAAGRAHVPSQRGRGVTHLDELQLLFEQAALRVISWGGVHAAAWALGGSRSRTGAYFGRV